MHTETTSQSPPVAPVSGLPARLAPVASASAATAGSLFAPPSRRARALREGLVHMVLLACGLLSILTTIGAVLVLAEETVQFFQVVPLLYFLTDVQWTPLFTEQHFGILPLLSATVLIAFFAMVVALPLGLLAAIYLSEYASPRVRAIVKPTLEILAGVPTVVYGYFALLFVTPLLQRLLPQTSVFNGLSASIVMGIMILPLVSSLSEDALGAVPRSLREGAYALGATRLEVATMVVTPAALSGIVAAAILAISRAVGETMIVAIAAGQQPQLTLNPLVPIQTMTAYIVQVSLGDTPAGSLVYRTIFAVGMALFLLTLALNVASLWIMKKFREVYE